MSFKVRQGDCVELMAAMPAGSVDAVVCDPPYGLEFMGKDWDRLGGDRRQTFTGDLDAGKHEGNPYWRSKVRYGQGASYSAHADAPKAQQEWHQAWATEALRVLKPGGHLLAFGGTRTYHRLVCAVEDAGFEIRDTISWLYGSGFPKSLDVGKAIDRAASCPACDGVGAFGGGIGVEPEPPLECSACGGTGRATREVVGSKLGQPGYSLAEDQGPGGVAMEGNVDGSLRNAQAECAVTAPATPEAERWEGWGTALKPAHEPIVVARKPLSGTVAGNVLEHGTGALAIDACRVGSDDFDPKDRVGAAKLMEDRPWQERQAEEGRPRIVEGHTLGRWPPNVALSHSPGCVQVGTRKVKGVQRAAGSPGFGADREDGYEYGTGRDHAPDTAVGAWSCTPDCPVRLLDEQTGELHAPGSFSRPDSYEATSYQAPGGTPLQASFTDSGGASRFFPAFEYDYEEEECALSCKSVSGAEGANPSRETMAAGSVGGAASPRNLRGERFRYEAKASRSERNAGLEGFDRCSCETFTEWVNEDQSESTPAGPDTPQPRATTESGTPSSSASGSPTTSSGSSTTDPSPTASKSTIATRTSRTTESKTSPSSLPASTSGSTPPTSAEAKKDGSGDAGSVANGNPPTASTTTSAVKAGSSTDAVDRAISPESSATNSGARCASCGGVVQGALRNSHPT